MLWRFLRSAVLVLGPIAAAWIGWRTRDTGLFLGLAGSWAVLGLGPALVPRMAHRAFRRGHVGRARLLYGALRRVSVDRAARSSLQVSVAACDLAQGRYRRALERLDRIAPERLGEPGRAAWLNNRAYALAREERDLYDALDDADEALALRPDVAGFRHTRGLALLGLGRLDEAIRELDSLWRELAGDETPALLEAERCYDLGRAWQRKGEEDFAADYLQRARRAAPDSRWGLQAGELLADAPAPTAPVAEFLEA